MFWGIETQGPGAVAYISTLQQLQYKDMIPQQLLTRDTTFIQWGQTLLLGNEPRSL